MIDALKRHPQCEDVYRCLVFKEIRILYIKEPSPKGFVFRRRRRTTTTTTTMRSSPWATFAMWDVAKKLKSRKISVTNFKCTFVCSCVCLFFRNFFLIIFPIFVSAARQHKVWNSTFNPFILFAKHGVSSLVIPASVRSIAAVLFPSGCWSAHCPSIVQPALLDF